MNGKISKSLYIFNYRPSLFALGCSHDGLGVELWEYERYAGVEWPLPPLVGVRSIECHIGRKAITIGGSMVWATVPLHRVSDAHLGYKY